MRAKLAWVLTAAAIAAVGAGPASAQERTTTVLSDIRQETNERQTRLTVECTGPLAYTYYSPDPLTLVVDIPEVDASKVPSRINVGSREVESLRVTSMARADGRNLARIEVRLASLAPYQIYSKGKELTLIFERPAALGRAETPEPAKADEPTVYVPAKPRVAPAPEPVPAAEAPSPAAAPAMAQNEPEPQAEPEAAVPANVPRATKILGVSSGIQDGRLTVTVRADGRLRHQDFFLGNPNRLVVDFPEVTSAAPVRSIEVNSEPVRKARIAQFSTSPSRVARLVLDLDAKAPYRIVERADGLKIVFGEGSAPAPTALAALRAPGPDPAAAPEPEPQVLPAPAPAPVLPAPLLPEPQIQPISSGPLAAQEIGPATGAKKYTGAPISLDFKDGDLQDIFRLFADISGLNVVVNPGVSGKVTLKLNEVPWDQALDLILKTNGLGYTLEDNVIRIARLGDLQKEEQEKRKLAEEKALAGDLVPYRARLSYAKASGLEPTVKKVALSPRGSITIDERTNTMIITDLQTYVDKAVDLIRDLDRATPQVEIEARIVVTSRNFTRQIGVQWGFLNQQTPQFGNTTGLSFPNSIILNGSGVGALNPTNQQNLAPNAGIGPAGRGYAVNLPASGFNTALGISMGNVLGSFNLDAALTALEQQGRGRILSTPKITTQNNQAAEIKQGVQIPIQTNVNNTISVTFKDATLTLKVTPQITDAGTVILNLEVSNDSPDFSRAVGERGIPPINTQSAKTIVLVKDGSTAVIGGIYQSQETTARQNTPFLANIPILGYLFRNNAISNQNTELLLFITPRIVKG
jgi:type IV pilus secretin PilQ/predicted competence protein